MVNTNFTYTMKQNSKIAGGFNLLKIENVPIYLTTITNSK